MIKNFLVNGETFRVFVWGDNFHPEVTVHTQEKTYDRTIRTDENGEKFFTWNKQRVYLKDYISMSMKELRDKINAGEWVTDDDLTLAILHDGVENVRFICPLHPITTIVPAMGLAVCDGGKYVNAVCKITEDRYKVDRNYKIGVVPENENLPVGTESYYTSDMLSLIKQGYIKILVEDETLH